MKTLTIGELTEGNQVTGFYAVRDANLRTTASGKSYIRMSLGDATGSLTGNYWDAGQEIFSTFAVGDVVKVRAVVETYQGNLQLKITALRPAQDSEYDAAAFLATTRADVGALQEELDRVIASIRDSDYRALMETFCQDQELREAFARTPAAKENHHACIGGLLEHTLSVVRTCEAFTQASTTPLNRDLLIAGALLHDIGKTQELAAGTAIEYTDVGKLVGHLTLGVIMVEKFAATIQHFPEEKKWLLQHMILSHHGRHEYGAPILPAIPEALALHQIDNLDAKTVCARRLIDEDAENDRRWTSRSWALDTQLYKGAMPQGEPRPAEPPSAAPARPAKSRSTKPKPSASGKLF